MIYVDLFMRSYIDDIYTNEIKDKSKDNDFNIDVLKNIDIDEETQHLASGWMFFLHHTSSVLNKANANLDKIIKRYQYLNNNKHISTPRYINMGGIPDNLAISNLFGHVKGAFTDAKNDKDGFIKADDEGYVIIDEIGNTSINVQNVILKFVESGEFTQLGSSIKLKSGAQLLFLTNKDLSKAIKDGNFKEDLFYRINTNHIHIPPLRERREDIVLLAKYFITEKFGYKDKIGDKVFPYDELKKYDWPGNTRELKYAINYACDANKETSNLFITSLENFPEYILAAIKPNEPEKHTLEHARTKWEAEYIKNTLERNDWHLTNTAKSLDISIQWLEKRIKKHNLK